MPNLTKQESISFSTFLKFLFVLYEERGDDESPFGLQHELDVGAEHTLLSVLVDETCFILARYLGYLKDTQKVSNV